MKIEETQVHTTVYLYGCMPSDFKDMRYEEAIIFKIKEGNKLLGRLYDTPIMSRDADRIRKVSKAITLNEALIKEMKR